jgi:hypothetical protein
MPDSIALKGYDALLKKLEALGRMDYAKAGVQAAGLYLKGALSEQPEQKRLTRKDVYGSSFKTDKQRRFFFWALKSGAIQVPYQRGSSPKSERFNSRWTVESENDGMSAALGNNTLYGPLLMQKENQSLYAKRVGWQTTEAVVDAEREKVVEIIGGSIQDGLEAE